MAGGFLGDFVKGRLKGQRPDALETGIKLHRAIDVFTDQHQQVKNSHRRFPSHLRRFAPIVTDIVYDHFLAKHWHQFDSTQSLPAFSQSAYDSVKAHQSHLPDQAALVIERMESVDALTSYKNYAFVEAALVRLSQRITRENTLAQSYNFFLRIEDELLMDFELFFPELITFSQRWVVDAAKPSPS
ncbi:MAG: ACP phosphodiesterase [Pseudomonadales bacterium]|nr:ACP phosphodiesterase [Pseudomonadales bacterium]MDG1442653.1 ACP phosphodiesterase [Pseudomonadales bacterium]